MYIKQYFPERLLALAAICGLLSAGLSACADAGGPLDPEKTYDQGATAEVEEPIGFTDQQYDFTGDTAIADLRSSFVDAINPSDRFSYGIGADALYPIGDERKDSYDCDFDPTNPYQSPIKQVPGLPATIEGVVTLHPRYFQKMTVCGEDQRYYGSFFLQDGTDGILVLHDSRVADFTFGNRVKLRVRGMVKAYDTYAVLAYDQDEVIEPDTKYDVYYETVTDRQLGLDDAGKVRRVSGEIVSEPTNANFNEMHVQGDSGTEWVISLDRELGLRGIGLKNGMRVQITGPVINSYNQNVILVASLGQIQWLDQQ